GRTSCTRSASRTSTRRASRSRVGRRALELATDATLARIRDDRSRDGDVPRGETVRFEDDDLVVGVTAARRAGDDILELVHLVPLQHAVRDRLDQIRRLELRIVDRVAADE